MSLSLPTARPAVIMPQWLAPPASVAADLHAARKARCKRVGLDCEAGAANALERLRWARLAAMWPRMPVEGCEPISASLRAVMRGRWALRDDFAIEVRMKDIARWSDTPAALLQSNRRTAEVAHLRHAAMWVMRRFTKRSLPRIGLCFGGRDHSTVLHAVRKVDDALSRAGIIVVPDNPREAFALALEALEARQCAN